MTDERRYELRLADEIDERDCKYHYQAKMPSARFLQRQGVTDDAIEASLGIKLERSDRMSLSLGGDQFCIFVKWSAPKTQKSGEAIVTGDICLSVNGVAIGPHSYPFKCDEFLKRLTHVWRPLFLQDVETDEAGLLSNAELQAPLELFPFVRLGRFGKTFLVQLGEVIRMAPIEQVYNAFREFGDLMADRLRLVAKGNDKAAADWLSARLISEAEYISYVTSLSIPRVRNIFDAANDDVRMDDVVLRRPEKLIAARMVAHILIDTEIKELIQQIDSTPLSAPDNALIEISAGAISLIESFSDERAWKQGHILARWARETLGIPADLCVDVRKELANLGLPVLERDLTAEAIDAISIWGEEHGPAIILNLSGRHVHNMRARQATLAHELCHALIDRERALPSVEVLGGKVLRPLEARARAFAAEFLLPLEAVRRCWQRAASVSDALYVLTRQFNVSKRLAAWQMHNAELHMNEDDDRLLYQILGVRKRDVGKYGDF